MTVPNQAPRRVSTAAAGATTFPYDFKVLTETDIEVQVDGVTKTLGVDYTVSGVGNELGGSIAFTAAMVGGETVMRRRNMPLTRTNDFQYLGDLRSFTLNNDQDAPVMMIQQLNDAIGRALKLPLSSTGSGEIGALIPLAPIVVSADGQSLQSGSTTLTGDMLLRGALAGNTGTSLVSFIQDGALAVGRKLEDKLREALSVSVLDYIPVDQHAAIKNRSSTYDCTAGFQAALNQLQARTDGGKLFIPNGGYRVTSQLNYSGKSIVIEGETEEGVKITSSAPVHMFNLIMNGPTGSVPAGATFNSCTVRNMFIYAASNSTGAAVNVEYNQNNGGQCQLVIENMRIANNQDAPFSFKYGIRTVQAGDMLIRKVFIGFFGNTSNSCIRLEHNNTAPAYNIRFEHLDLNGALYGIYGTGWMESVYIGAGTLIVGSDECIVFDATGTPFGNPHLYITGVHLNGKKNTVKTIGWRTIYMLGCDVFTGVGVGDVAGRIALFDGADWVHLTGCKFEQGFLGITKEGVGLNNVRGYAISGCSFYNINGTPISAFGTNSDRGSITGNTIYSDSINGTTAIYVAGTANYCTITGNNIKGYQVGIDTSAAGNATLVTGNLIRQAGVGIAGRAETDARGNIMPGVPTPFSTTSLVGRREFFATATVDPPSIATGARATVLVNVNGVRLGDLITFSAPYDISDLTVTANAQNADTIGLYFKNDSGATKDLAPGTWKFRVCS